jgi:3-hydroxyacyl-CoA dehydrogenase/enoyl-CoA hydratase/3-hydroxybutyryl-CoA epimerase
MEPTASRPSPHLRSDPEGIAWIVFDDPSRKLNVLTEPVMQRFAELLDEVRSAAEVGSVKVLVVTSGKADSFMAGADVDAIEALEDPVEAETKVRRGQAIFMDLEQLPVPTVAAIHGICLGGGVEMALACRHRVLSDAPETRLGLPEVMLGFLPSWGGTTRLPRLVGLQAALVLLLTGKQIDARKAKRIGLVGEILPADLFQEKVREFALKSLELPRGASRLRRKLLTRAFDDTLTGRRIVLAAAKKKVLAKTGGHYPAPLRILEVLRDNVGRSVERSLAAEAHAAGELIVSSTCKNLVHVFNLRRAARKATGVADASVQARAVRSMAVLGAGVMGGAVAQLAAYREVRVRMKDIEHDAVTRGLRHARSLFDQAVERRKLTRRVAAQRMEFLSGGLDFAGFAGADLVVEAVVERVDTKQAVLREAESHVGPECILATNTSSLSVDELAAGLERPDRFCGMHFFNPVHRMPLVEVVRGSHTSDGTIATVYGFARFLGKVPVVVRDGPGFLVNRILGPYLNEAGHLLADGASVHAIDDAAKAFGMPMGPLRLIDEVGVDVSAHAGGAMHAALGERLTPAAPLVALAASSRLGRKGGRGFYTYQKGRDTGVDETVYADLGTAVPGQRAKLQKRAIRQRLVMQMINEAARVLEEGIVDDAAAVDLAMIMGTGFPPFRGGLLRFADSFHLRAVHRIARDLQDELGDRFEPPELLADLARRSRTFYGAFGG